MGLRDEPAASCHGCRTAFSGDDALLVSFGGRLWHTECLQCASCAIVIPDPDTPLLLLSDGRPVCRECPYMCCMCHRSLPDEKIYKDDVPVYGMYDSLFGSSSETSIVLARHLQRIWCTRCRVPDTRALPPEILRRVLFFVLPEPTPRPFDRRTTVLRDLCRVNRTWRAVAQPELFVPVVLAWWGQERRFLTAVEKRPELGELAKVLRLGDGGGGRAVPAPPFKLGRLFELCPTVGDLHLSHLSSIAPDDVLKAQAVKTLTCTSLSFTSSISLSPSPLHHLHQLAFTNCDLSLLPASFLTPATLPSLRTLSLRHATEMYTQAYLGPLIPSLTSLSTDTNHRLALADHMPTATSLRAISLHGELATDLVGRMTSPLLFLHLPRWDGRDGAGGSFAPATLIALIKDAAEHGVLDERATLILPRSWTTLKDVESTCAKRGIRLRTEEGVLFEDVAGDDAMEVASAHQDPAVQTLFWKLVGKVAADVAVV